MHTLKKYLLFFALLILSGCLTQTKTEDKLSKIGAQSCLSATAVAYDGVMITIDIPDEAVRFMIKRDGVPILETSDKEITTKIDTGLLKGQTYRYTCAAILDVNQGFRDLGQELVVNLESDTPPIFGGITDATPEGANSIRVSWDLASDEVISHYKVYKYIGIASNKSQFSNSVAATIYDLSLSSFLLEGLGDQLDYSFRVVACNTSDICDDNDAIESAILADTGAPLTTGISDIGIINGEVRLTAPWDDSKGLVSKRTVYRLETTTGATCPTTIGSYSPNDINVAIPRDTPVSFNAPGSINEGVRYCYIVRDTDSLAQQETNTNIRFIDVGDLTPPVFNTSFNLVRDVSFPENRLLANWIAIENESENALAGANEYVIYISSSIPPAQPDSDPCSTGSQYGAPISAMSFPQGMNISIPISGLSRRNNHRVCIRAKDSSGNFATNEPKSFQSTGDVTPPLFNGIDNVVFNGLTNNIDVNFIVPNDSDVKNYLIKISRNRSGTVTQLSDIPVIIGVQQPGSVYTYSLTQAQASAQSDDVLTVRVDSCDDANPTYNTSDNCTATSVSRNVLIPDSEPPAGFQFITYTVAPGSAESSVIVNWSSPPSWDDYAGFKLHYVDGGGNLVNLDSSDCVCNGLDCSSSPKNSCEVFRTDGAVFLDPSRQYEFYLSAYDTDGFSTQQYIDYTGGSKKTAFARTRDKTKPTFNADFTHEINNGVIISFSPATDNQYSGAPDNHQLTYQIYRKEDTAYSFPCLTGDSQDPECDGASLLISTQTESQLSFSNGKFSFTDTNIDDGKTYFYQVCAFDFAYSDSSNPFNGDDSTNRQCQTGSIAQVSVTDTTPPTADNVHSNKRVDRTYWTVTFDVGDNSPLDQLSVKIYRSSVDYPDEMSPGTPLYTSPTSVTVDSMTGVTSFDDTGAGGPAEYYYLAEVSDAANNKVFIEFRDMLPPPIITGVSFIGGPLPNGETPPTVLEASTSKPAPNQRVRVVGTGLDNVKLFQLRDNDNPNTIRATCGLNIFYNTTETEAICDFEDRVPAFGKYRIFIMNSTNQGDQQSFMTGPDAIEFREFCEIYPDRNSMQGTGSGTNPFGICFPEHLNLISASGEKGFFRLLQDIDFATDALPGFTFSGIDTNDTDDIKINGNGFSFTNLIIDSTTGGHAGFIKGISNASSLPNPVLEDINFINSTFNINGSTAFDVGFLIGTVISSGTGFVEPVKNVSIDGLTINLDVGASNVGGIFGQVNRNGFANIEFNSGISVNNLTLNLNPPVAITTAGGFIGRIGLRGNDIKIDGVQMSNITINQNANVIYLGAFIGIHGVTSNTTGSWTISNNDLTNLNLVKTVRSNNIGGLIGYQNMHSSSECLGACVISDNFVDFNYDGTALTNNSTAIGGLVGFADIADGASILRNRVDFNFRGSGSDASVGGLYGTMRSKQRSDYSSLSEVFIEENLIEADVLGVGSRLGGIAANFLATIATENYTYKFRNNKVSALNNFASLDESSATFGRCSIGSGSVNNILDIENNLLQTKYNGSGLEYDPVMSNDAGGPCVDSPGLLTINLSKNYYDTTLSGGLSVFEATGEAEGKTTTELRAAPSSSVYDTWDFTNVWRDRSGSSQVPNHLWQ